MGIHADLGGRVSRSEMEMNEDKKKRETWKKKRGGNEISLNQLA